MPRKFDPDAEQGSPEPIEEFALAPYLGSATWIDLRFDEQFAAIFEQQKKPEEEEN